MMNHGHLDGLIQERCNSIANALELHLSCTNPSICDAFVHANYTVKRLIEDAA